MIPVLSGYTITFEGEHDGEEHWTATCRCGWWNYGLCSRRAAEKALERHAKYDARHRP